MEKKPRRPQDFRMTPQRAAILRLLEGNKSHPSAEDIYARLKRKFPGMSFATVYNTLQSLLERGSLIEVRIDSERTRFDPGLKPHAHLLCTACGAIADLPAPPRLKPAGAPRGYKIHRFNVEFYGVCPDCGRKSAKKENRSCPKKKHR